MESSTYEFTDREEMALPEKSLHQGRLFDTPRAGNLSWGTVSNAGRTRATSHPCERGAGLLQKQAGTGVAILTLWLAVFFGGGV
jgi:hypothetical protein